MGMTDKPPVDAGEWEMQERGMRAARGHEAGGRNAATEGYRVVAEALVAMPRSEPPADFAAGVARRIVRHDAGLESLLSRVLLAVFVAASVFACVHYGGQGWRPLRQALGEDALGWVLAALGCVALSWACGRLAACADAADGPRHAT